MRLLQGAGQAQQHRLPAPHHRAQPPDRLGPLRGLPRPQCGRSRPGRRGPGALQRGLRLHLRGERARRGRPARGHRRQVRVAVLERLRLPGGNVDDGETRGHHGPRALLRSPHDERRQRVALPGPGARPRSRGRGGQALRRPLRPMPARHRARRPAVAAHPHVPPAHVRRCRAHRPRRGCQGARHRRVLGPGRLPDARQHPGYVRGRDGHAGFEAPHRLRQAGDHRARQGHRHL